MILPLRRAQNVKLHWLDLKNRIQGFWQGGSAAGRGGREIQKSSRWDLKNRLDPPATIMEVSRTDAAQLPGTDMPMRSAPLPRCGSDSLLAKGQQNGFILSRLV